MRDLKVFPNYGERVYLFCWRRFALRHLFTPSDTIPDVAEIITEASGIWLADDPMMSAAFEPRRGCYPMVVNDFDLPSYQTLPTIIDDNSGSSKGTRIE